MKTIEELTDELLLFFNGFASWESSVIRSSDLTVSEDCDVHQRLSFPYPSN